MYNLKLVIYLDDKQLLIEKIKSILIILKEKNKINPSCGILQKSKVKNNSVNICNK